ncbi:MAG: ABC transporter ATP-binding protein [Clostridia bacterium]|nr:ABC transporter ATP-binding protein [Clostridia bacterium]
MNGTERSEVQTEAVEAMVKVESLTKRYGERVALSGLSLSFAKGGIHGILGPAGAGKTTLMELLSGSLAADGGSITVGGVAVSTSDPHSRRRIGYLRERPVFPRDMTAEEVLDLVGASRGVAEEKRYRQIKEALELCGLEEARSRLCARLSSEERQRLGLAGALMGNPDVVLLDEPLRGGSADRNETVTDIVRMLGKIKTVVLATSDFCVARALCSEVAILSEGVLLTTDTFEGLEEKLLGSRTLTVGTRGDAQALLAALKAIPHGIGCELARNGRTGELRFRLDYRTDRDIREAVSAALTAQGAPILSMSDDALSLEEVYHSLTASSATKESAVPRAETGERQRRVGRKGKEAAR